MVRSPLLLKGGYSMGTQHVVTMLPGEGRGTARANSGGTNSTETDAPGAVLGRTRHLAAKA